MESIELVISVMERPSQSKIWEPREPGDPPTVCLSVRLDDNTITTAVGPAQVRDLVRGMSLRLFGRWKDHHRFGRQFQFKSYVVPEPVGKEAVTAYLCRAPGIGPVTAAVIWDLYGTEAVKVIRENPERVALEGGLNFTLHKVVLASDFFKRNAATENVKMELFGLLDGHGFRKKLPGELIKVFGVEAPGKVRTKTFETLIPFAGCGFQNVDKLYLHLGNHPGSIERQAYCGWSKLHEDSNGHTWISQGKFELAIEERIPASFIDHDKNLDYAMKNNLVYRTYQDGLGYLALPGRAHHEEELATLIGAARVRPNLVAGFMENVKPNVSDHQFLKMTEAFASDGGLSILGGSPGTGKTRSLAFILKEAIKAYGNAVAAAAPTGKAAVRMTQAMRDHDVLLTATTIHSLLGVSSLNKGSWVFDHRAEKPLPHRVIVIDEFSMVDTSLMYHLLSATSRSCNLILVGDVNQLPPVGSGAPLRDMIAAGLPHGEMTEIRRNTGGIVKACAEIRDTKSFSCPSQVNLESGENLALHQMGVDDIAGWIEEFYNNCPVDDHIRKTQVLVPINDKSSVSRKKINPILQGILNPLGEKTPGREEIRIGDKVIFLSNEQRELAKGHGKVYVANGDQGIVIDYDPGERQFSIELFGIGDVRVHAGLYDNFDLAFAITTHKMQGDQSAVVIVVSDTSGGARMVMNRPWIYTAISRATQECHIVGSHAVIQRGLQKDGIGLRKTFLRERLTGEFTNPLSEAEISDIFSIGVK